MGRAIARIGRIRLGSLGLVSLGLLSGCGIVPVVSSRAVSKAPPGNPVMVAQQPVHRQNFPNPLQPPQSPTVPPVPEGIPLTVPEDQAAAQIGDRPDPFAALPVTPIVTQVPPSPPTADPVPVPSAASDPPIPQVPPTVMTSIAPSAPANAAPPVSAAPPAIATAPSAPAPPPPQPSIALAQAIQITGVVQIQNHTSVIVQVPNESTTRSVAVGEYLANGEVLVKRIETQGLEPRVVFEQNGREVIKAIGAGF